ncbi:MAG: hypothetical protein WDA00_07475, partial [Eubacteriales bacterium]
GGLRRRQGAVNPHGGGGCDVGVGVRGRIGGQRRMCRMAAVFLAERGLWDAGGEQGGWAN